MAVIITIVCYRRQHHHHHHHHYHDCSFYSFSLLLLLFVFRVFFVESIDSGFVRLDGPAWNWNRIQAFTHLKQGYNLDLTFVFTTNTANQLDAGEINFHGTVTGKDIAFSEHGIFNIVSRQQYQIWTMETGPEESLKLGEQFDEEEDTNDPSPAQIV